MLCVTVDFQALDVGRGFVGDPRAISCEDLGLYKHSVLTVKGKVSILQEQGWVATSLRGQGGRGKGRTRGRG